MRIENENYYSNGVESGPDFMMNVCFDPFNKRMRVDDYRGNICSIENKIRELAGKYAFTKVIVKTRPEHWQTFLSRGYMLEGVFKGYFNGSDAYSMALYFDLERRTSGYWIEEDEILDRVLSLPQKFERPDLPSGYALRLATADDADQLAVLYNDVFQTYPTPMNKPHYIKNVMEEGTLFFLIENSGRIVSAASAEVNASYHNAEMTDCATLPEHRKHGLMRVLIIALEQELLSRRIYCAYSLARSLSFGMNAVFHQLGYSYTGRLTKNCNIFDKFEDMSLWVKNLSDVN